MNEANCPSDGSAEASSNCNVLMHQEEYNGFSTWMVNTGLSVVQQTPWKAIVWDLTTLIGANSN
jgi:hypothetical protein